MDWRSVLCPSPRKEATLYRVHVYIQLDRIIFVNFCIIVYYHINVLYGLRKTFHRVSGRGDLSYSF